MEASTTTEPKNDSRVPADYAKGMAVDSYTTAKLFNNEEKHS